MLKKLISTHLQIFCSQDFLQDERGFFQGLIEDLARELKLENLTYAFEDRTVLTVLFLAFCVLVLVLVPIILAVYAAGIKSFHRHLTKLLNGVLTLDTTFVGFPLYPIKIEGSYAQRNVSFQSIQKVLYAPKLVTALEYYKRRYTKVITVLHIGSSAPKDQGFIIRSRKFIPQGIPEGFTLCKTPDPLIANDFEIIQNSSTHLEANWDNAAFALLHNTANKFPGLTISLDTGMYHITCSGPLRGKAKAELILRVLEFCK